MVHTGQLDKLRLNVLDRALVTFSCNSYRPLRYRRKVATVAKRRQFHDEESRIKKTVVCDASGVQTVKVRNMGFTPHSFFPISTMH